MIPALKSCYVLLNKNFLDLREANKMINYFPKVELKNCENSSYRNKISDRKTSHQKIVEENYSHPRNKEQVNDSDDIKNTEDEDSDPEFSYDSSSLDDEETTQKQKRKTIHDSSKTGSKKLSCLLCKETFRTYSSYLIHQRSHESKPYKCIICRQNVKKRQSFLQHMKNFHPEVDPFICEYRGCEQSFKTQKGLEIHGKMHRRYMCKYCKKLFARKQWMKKHVLKIH